MTERLKKLYAEEDVRTFGQELNLETYAKSLLKNIMYNEQVILFLW